MNKPLDEILMEAAVGWPLENELGAELPPRYAKVLATGDEDAIRSLLESEGGESQLPSMATMVTVVKRSQLPA